MKIGSGLSLSPASRRKMMSSTEMKIDNGVIRESGGPFFDENEGILDKQTTFCKTLGYKFFDQKHASIHSEFLADLGTRYKEDRKRVKKELHKVACEYMVRELAGHTEGNKLHSTRLATFEDNPTTKIVGQKNPLITYGKPLVIDNRKAWVNAFMKEKPIQAAFTDFWGKLDTYFGFELKHNRQQISHFLNTPAKTFKEQTDLVKANKKDDIKRFINKMPAVLKKRNENLVEEVKARMEVFGVELTDIVEEDREILEKTTPGNLKDKVNFLKDINDKLKAEEAKK